MSEKESAERVWKARKMQCANESGNESVNKRNEFVDDPRPRVPPDTQGIQIDTQNRIKNRD